MAQSAGKQRAGKRSSTTKKSAAVKTAKGTAAEGNGGDAAPNGSVQNMTDLDFLRGLIEAVDGSGIDSLEINRAGTRIRIAKTPPAATVQTSTSAPPAPAFTAAPAAPPADTAAAPAAPAAAAAAASAVESNLADIASPMVGTFYRAPAPDAPPYVEVGSSVTKGQTLCILEAMKLMNELEAEVDGVVREILAEDSDPVEYGQVLFRIEPSGSKS